MDRARKAQEIETLAEKFGKAKAAFLVDFKGMNVEEVTTLRKELRPNEAEMRVVRNTLAKLAIKQHPEIDSALSEHFQGTNAVIFSYGEASAPAKTLSEFGKKVEHLQMKVGVMEGQALDEGRIKYLATLPSKEELQAKLLGTFQAPMSKFVQQLAAPSESFARLLGAYRDSKQ